MGRTVRLAGLVAAPALVAVLLTGCGTGSSGFDGAELAQPIALPAVTLHDTSGQAFNLQQQTRGKLTLVYFGYTNCPDVCPTTMADLHQAIGALSAADQRKVQVVFVTTDPQHDTPAALRAWLDSFSASFIGLTGSLRTVQATAGKFGVDAENPTTDASGHVTDTHGAQVIAFSPSDSKGHLVWLTGTKVSQYTHDMKLLLTNKT